MTPRGYKKVTLPSIGLILVVCRNYNVLHYFYFENYWLGKETYISKNWKFKFCIFNSKMIFCIDISWKNKCTNLKD